MSTDFLAALSGMGSKNESSEGAAETPEVDPEGSGDDTGIHEAATEVMDAFEAKDVQALSDALKAFIQMV